MLSLSLHAVGTFQNPPQFRGFIAVQMRVGERGLIIFPVSLS
jgi:hypothetical protein